jgi:hypothetical protein
MDDVQRKVMQGGLSNRCGFFWMWFYVTYVASCVGLSTSFYIYAIAPPSLTPVMIFSVYLLSLSIWDSAVLEQNTRIVLVCLLVNAAACMCLFGYTFYLFPLGDLWVLHVANAVLVVYTLVNGFYLWQWGWLQSIDMENQILLTDSLPRISTSS